MLVFINELMAPAFIMPVITKERSINFSYCISFPMLVKSRNRLGLFKIILLLIKMIIVVFEFSFII